MTSQTINAVSSVSYALQNGFTLTVIDDRYADESFLDYAETLRDAQRMAESFDRHRISSHLWVQIYPTLSADEITEYNERLAKIMP